MATLEIHEFSTGIQVDGSGDRWVSRGFTGDYMNKTINPIPPAVQNAIANREFAVAEGASRNEPAVIGREVVGNEEEWSVVVVVTRGRDDRGRSVSLYRYFLCEELGKLQHILCWMRQQRRVQVFDPFDSKTVGQPNLYDDHQTNEIPIKPELQDLLTEDPPIIIPHNLPCTPLIIHEMVEEKVKNIDNKPPIAWAFKVEALEKPTRFHLIQPASAKAEQLLQKAKTSTPQVPTAVAEEGQIKTAIKGLISREKLKLDQLCIFEAALGNPQIDDDYWRAIFEGQGTKDALSQGIYSAPMVRLLTLQAIARPTTLPQFLSWMQKRENQQDHYGISENFQVQIIKNLAEQAPQIAERVTQGVNLIIPQLIKLPEILDSTVWLLGSQRGIWRSIYYHETRKQLDQDLIFKQNYRQHRLENLPLKILNNESWKAVRNELEIIWQPTSFYFNPKYLPIARLFEKLGDYKLAIFFYYVAQEIIPKEVFFKCGLREKRYLIYGIYAKREVSFWEELWIFVQTIGVKIMPIYAVIPLMIICIALGFGAGTWMSGNKVNNTNPQTLTPQLNPEEEIKSKARQKFQETKASIEQIKADFVKHHNQDNSKIDKIIADILAPGMNLLVSKMDDEQDKWIEAILIYQKNTVRGTRDGIINKNQKTFNIFKCDLADKIGKKLAERHQDCSILESPKNSPPNPEPTTNSKSSQPNQNNNQPPRGE